jgi:hypothetical protein
MSLRELVNPWDELRRKDYAYQVKIACDDLHFDPFDPAARSTLLMLLVENAPPGDLMAAAVNRELGRAAGSDNGRGVSAP